jgi:hypothetical protein
LNYAKTEKRPAFSGFFPRGWSFAAPSPDAVPEQPRLCRKTPRDLRSKSQVSSLLTLFAFPGYTAAQVRTEKVESSKIIPETAAGALFGLKPERL